MCRPPWSYSNSSRPWAAMKSSNPSSCCTSTPGMGKPADGGVFLLFLDPFMKGSDLEEPSRRAGDHFGAAGQDGHVIFDANSTDALQVDPRLQSHDITHANFLCLSSAKSRRFMNFDTQAVASAMYEIAPQPAAIERTPRRPVHGTGCNSGYQSFQRRLLSLFHGAIPSAHVRGGLPQVDRARQVAAIVAQ